MQIFDTLSRDLKELKTVNGKRLNVFVCGPTVYDKPHLGHARTYIFFDIFIRYLRYKGLRPFYLMNITDIDDKIINRANSENVPYNEISRRYSTEFFKIMKALRNESVNYYAFATDFINEIISQIERLMEKGYAYETSDGVYYSVEKFQDYGKLSHQDITQLKAGARVETNENKKNPLDFALWKKRKPNEPYWNSPWGEGRPGWHIEDTAITERFFGYHYDLHGGGIDLVFPHHEAEIAQMEAISGKPPLVDYWVHTGHLSVENVKMSKSLGNFITVEEILKSYWPESVRLMFIGMNYRDTSNFIMDGLNGSQTIAEKLTWIYRRVADTEAQEKENYDAFMKEIKEPLEKNMNTPDSLVAINDFIKWASNELNKTEGKNGEIKAILDDLDSIFGIVRRAPIPEAIVNTILEIRKSARAKGDYATSDKIRSDLSKLGIKIEDRGNESFAWW